MKLTVSSARAGWPTMPSACTTKPPTPSAKRVQTNASSSSEVCFPKPPVAVAVAANHSHADADDEQQAERVDGELVG